MKLRDLPTPCYVIDEERLTENLRILEGVRRETGCKILLAQKAFSCYYFYPLIGKYLDGATASGLFEARLGREEMGKENHVFSPAYRRADMDELGDICDHVICNSMAQLARWQEWKENRARRKAQEAHGKAEDAPRDSGGGEKRETAPSAAGPSLGLRINPECSTQEGHAIYDPCAPGSRLGVTAANFDPACLDWIDGLHFHTLCEQDADALKTTLDAVEEKFGKYLSRLSWLNMGGGHHITREGYDISLLRDCIRRMQEKYGLTVYLEPGEAVALNAGYLATEVMDVVENGGLRILILDASAACHMPDVLEMPYRPPLKDAGLPGEKKYTYRLSSCTCLAGDVIGDYSFDREIQAGDRLYFKDMAIYTMVKNNTFNGMPLPSIAVMDRDGECRVIREFGYADFKGRL